MNCYELIWNALEFHWNLPETTSGHRVHGHNWLSYCDWLINWNGLDDRNRVDDWNMMMNEWHGLDNWLDKWLYNRYYGLYHRYDWLSNWQYRHTNTVRE